jgi:hypothetical protein
MALPQQLEVLMGQTAGSSGADGEQQQQQQQVEEEEGDELAAEWLDKVGSGVGLIHPMDCGHQLTNGPNHSITHGSNHTTSNTAAAAISGVAASAATSRVVCRSCLVQACTTPMQYCRLPS